MTNIRTKLISLALAACILCVISVSVSAAEIDKSGGSGSTPVNLTTTNGDLDGDGGSVTTTKLNVTVPTSLAGVKMDSNKLIGFRIENIRTTDYGVSESFAGTVDSGDELPQLTVELP